MKHVGQLAIIGALPKAVNTSRVRTMQGRTYLIKRRLYRWSLLQTYYRLLKTVSLENAIREFSLA